MNSVKHAANQIISWAPFVSDSRCARYNTELGSTSKNASTAVKMWSASCQITPGMARRQTFKIMTGFGLLGAGAGLLVLSLIAGVEPTALLYAGAAVGGTGALWMLCLFIKRHSGNGRGERIPFAGKNRKKLGNLLPTSASIKSLLCCCSKKEASPLISSTTSELDLSVGGGIPRPQRNSSTVGVAQTAGTSDDGTSD